MDANEQKARELLAAEYAKAYAEPFGAPIDSHAIAVRVIAKALAQQAPADGEWVLVPREPTQAMLDATDCAERLSRATWAKMIAVSPQAPQPVVDECPDCAFGDKGAPMIPYICPKHRGQPQQGAVEAADAEKAFFARDFYEEAKAGKVPWPCGTYSPTIGQQAVDDACNCPGGSKPASMHAPNCPVRTTENK